MPVSQVQAWLLPVTDRLVRLSPSPLRVYLNKPVTGSQTAAGLTRSRILRFAWITSVALSAVLAVSHLVNTLVLDGRFGILDADKDQSIMGWTGVAVEAAVAAVLGLLAAGSVRPATLTFCAATVAFLSFDDFIQIHERIGGLLSPFPHAGRLLWPLLYLPLLAALLVQLWRVAENADPAERALVRAGLLALVLAVGLEFCSPLLFAGGQGRGTPGYEIEVAIEECLELAGWLWIGGGLAAFLVCPRLTGEAHLPSPTRLPDPGC
ncbi:hypothetical protein EV138_0914 [Kribbella voronezhensis]|uniref:Uncharacterized protein n=1 Tax=Kribbella voronezhensis TaxID=2512212 RepID=A0A4R7T6F5_9ACTN|nr:hypothetical protein [Kribbella voronezhensis]TDU87391.1 hypothetical protein EV138_0914 [Kribbella voronezhensis]